MSNEVNPKQFEWLAMQAMFKLRNSFKEFSGDDLYRELGAAQVPPNYIRRFAGSFFRQFLASGYIKKLKTYKLSERNGSSPLPLYIGVPS